MDKNTRGQERDKRLNTPKPESQSKKKMTTMPKETIEDPVLAANADSDVQPSWVAAFQASMQTTLACMQVKMDAGRQNMETKLDKISKQMDDALKGVRDEMARLREEMGQIRTEATQSLDSCREETRNRIAAVEMDIRDQRKDMGLVEERIGETEEWNTEAQDFITTLIEQQSKLQEKLTDLEGRSRRNNIRIWGVKEGLEGDSAKKYIEELIDKELDVPGGGELQIQRAHRAPAPRPAENKPARAIIVNFLSFDVKENVLKTAWKKSVQVAGQRVTFDHDYSTEIAAKRRDYAGLKRILKEKGLRFQSPMATLRIHWSDGTKVYDNPQEAARAMRQRGLEVPVRGEERPTLQQRAGAIRKWTRVGRRECGDLPATRTTRDPN